jgi:hypothetical protein
MILGLKPCPAKPSLRRVVVLTLAMAAVGTAAQAGPRALFYERSLVAAADARCGLFDAATGSALASAAAQARGAALRAGDSPADIAAAAHRARTRAAATPCGSPELATVAGRVRHAFQGWSRTARMTFHGERAGWAADRTAFARPTWRLVQSSAYRDAPIAFGQVGGPGMEPGLAAVVSFPGRPRPYAARIVMRDPARAQRPWIVSASLAPLPPASVQRSIFSTSRSLAPATLLADGRRSGLLWRFPAATAEAIAALDPRETFTVEFLFHDDSVARASFEAGDFVAAQAFLAMGEL